MENQNLISVIVPVYNSEAYLEACCASILAQSYAHLELLLVDDGSTDGSWLKMQEIAEGDARVRLLRQKNGGVSTARNLGMSKAKGRYCAFVDSDDTVSPDYLETALTVLQRENADFAALSEDCPGDPYWPQGHILENSAAHFASDADRLHFILKEYLPCKLGFNLHGKLFDLEFLRRKEIRFFKGISLGEDMAFLLLCLMHADGAAADSSVAYTYYHREESLFSGEKGTVTLRGYDVFLSRIAGVMPGEFWEQVLPLVYMRTMDVQFRQKKAKEMAPYLTQLADCRLWKKMVERGARSFGLFCRTLGWKTGGKLWLKLCMYGALLGDCPQPYALLGKLLARISGARLESI